MQELWIPWNTKTSSDTHYTFVAFEDVDTRENDTCVAILRNMNNDTAIKIVFEKYMGACRLTEDQHYIQKRLANSEHDLIFFKNNFLFKIENSEYLSMLLEQSYHVIKSPYNSHYLVLLEDILIDVFTRGEPRIRYAEQ